MAQFLPLFPLNVVVFPGEKLNLHIFEPRYRELITECQAEQKNFGIPVFVHNAVGQFGTEIEILSVDKKYDNGEMDIKTRGLRSFRILEFFRELPGKSFAGGMVEMVGDIQDEDPDLKARMLSALEQLYQALGLQSLFMGFSSDFKTYDVAHHLGFTIEKEYELLQCASEKDRQLLVVDHLERVLPVIMQTEKIKERVKLNGHFKHLYPPSF